MKKWIGIVGCLFLLGTSAKVTGAGLIIVSDPEPASELVPHITPLPPRPPRPAPPFVPPGQRRFGFAPLEVTSVQIAAAVKDQVASTTVEQEFYNPNTRQMEGTFLFPLPRGAHVDKFVMEIGGKPVEAELLDADKARRFYEEIVRKAKDPALLEYAGRDLLKARIFPIEPNSHKHITLTYSELLKLDSGMTRYAVPLGGGKFSTGPIRNVRVKVKLETSQPLKSIYSPTHIVDVRRHDADRAEVTWESKDARPEGDLELFFAAKSDELGFSLMTHPTGPQEGYFLLLAAPGWEVKAHKPLPKDVVFVLDTSGSMAGPKLEQAKRALAFCVENLNDDDQFDVIRFATETEPLFNHLERSSPENRTRATRFIQQLKPIGGTAIDEALHKALSMRPRQSDHPFIIVFLTDGRPTVGTTDEDRIVARATTKNDGVNTRIFCFGIGTDVNTHLLDRITEETHAYSQYVLADEDIEVKVSNFFSKIKEPMLANLKLDVGDGVRLSSQHPSDLPDLFQGEQLALVGRYEISGQAESIPVTLTGTAAGETKHYSFQARFPRGSETHENSFIPRLWATRRVGYLLDQIRLHGENKELKDEVTQLARQYGIVTPYTAYLILEDETDRGVPVALQSMPRLRDDLPAQEAAGRFYSKVNRDKSGDSAVAGARYGLALRQVDNLQALSAGNEEARRGFAASTAPAAPLSGPVTATRQVAPEAKRLAEYSQHSQFVAGRNFFLNGQQWVDAAVQKQTNSTRVQIQFNSDKYFDLLRQYPETAAWLALGPNVQFVWQNRIYEISE